MAANTLMRTFQRVRMNIDQNLGRAEKSEVLNLEEQSVERRVELLKNVCQNFHKKIAAFLKSHGTSTDVEKRLKKLPESGLSHCLIEASVQFGQDTGSGQVFHMLGDTEGVLAGIVLAMETEIEQKVMGPVRDIVEVDYPTIMKLKKQLSSRALDLDTAKSRYATMQKQSQAGVQTKLDEARNEMEDATTKVEQTKDQLATEMYNFVSKESEISQCLQELARIQAHYHRQSLSILERLIPQMQESIEFIIKKPIFGQSLQDHLDSDNREIAYVLEECISILNEYALEEEGLFRIAGSAVKIKKLRAAFNSLHRPVLALVSADDLDLHVIASILKLYLRELPEPLMSSDLYNDWFQTLQRPADQRLSSIRDVVNRLPKANYDNLRFLIKFLAKLSEFSEVNKMSASNISLVIGPNLLWADGETGPNMLMTGLQSSIVEILIANANYFFPGNIDFSSGRPLNTPSSAGAPPFDGGSGTQSSCISLGSITANILTGVAPSDSISPSTASPGTLKRDKAPKKPPAPLPPSDRQQSSADSVPTHQSFGKSLSSGLGPISGGGGSTSLRLSAPESGEVTNPAASPGVKHERPKQPPPERPQLPPPEKPTSSEKPPLIKDKPPGTRATVFVAPLPQEKPAVTAKPVLIDSDKCNAGIYPNLSYVEKEYAVNQAPASHQTHVRQSSYSGVGGCRPPRPKPPSPPPGRP